MFLKFLHDQRGEDLIEYGLIASIISIAAVVTIRLIGPPITNMFTLVFGALS